MFEEEYRLSKILNWSIIIGYVWCILLNIVCAIVLPEKLSWYPEWDFKYWGGLVVAPGISMVVAGILCGDSNRIEETVVSSAASGIGIGCTMYPFAFGWAFSFIFEAIFN